ncbi:hypothetical protein VTK73DRAFT_990 [Phialemonium thermophilum]|uniref:Uncharacterized protein n=1 Tax=Phialemonium thermophilum TaxID=223376 RepID=A0ABR3XBW6_9PEZI
MKSAALFCLALLAPLGMCDDVQERYSKTTCPAQALALNSRYLAANVYLNMNSNAINIGDCVAITNFLARGDIKDKHATIPAWQPDAQTINNEITFASPVAWKQKNFSCQFWVATSMPQDVVIKASTMGYYLEQLIGCLNENRANIVYSTQKEDNNYIFFMVSPAEQGIDVGPMLSAYANLDPRQFRGEPQNQDGQNSPLN